jgi:hypothetical protein
MMPGYYENTGGLSSLPRRTVLGGEEHLLSYITPEEAQMLREEGGGVTPTGGQYRGPGGLPAFAPSGATGSGSTGAPGAGGTGGHSGGTPGHATSAQGDAGNTGPGGPVGYGGYGNPLGLASNFSYGMDADNPSVAQAAVHGLISAQDALAKATEIAVSEQASEDAGLNEAADAAAKATRADQAKALANLSKARARAKSLGFVPGLASQANVAANQGIYSGLGMHGQVLSPSQVMSLPTAAFSNPAVANALGLGQVGDPNSVFGLAVQGLAKGLFGLMAPPAITGLYSAAEQVGDLTGLYSIPSIGDMALVSMVGDIFGEVAPETAQDISDVYGDVKGFIGDIPGDIADATGLSDVGKAIGEGLSSVGDAIGNIPGDIGLTAPEISLGEAVGEALGLSDVGDAIGEGLSSVGETVGEGVSSVADAIGLSDALGFVGETADTVGTAVGDTFSLGQPSTPTVSPQGGGPGIPQSQGFSLPPVLTPAQKEAPTFKTYPPRPPRPQESLTVEDIFSRYIGSPTGIQQYPEGFSLADIQDEYISSSPIYTYSGGGGIRSLPTRPIIGGQQHELSYITPEESRLLRQHGGGVTPNGGQLKVGGLNTYSTPARRFGEGPVLPGVWWDQEEQDRLDAFIDSGGFTDMRYDPERDRRRAENWRRRFPEEHQRLLEERERKFGSDILRPIPRPRLPADTIGRDPFTTDPTPSPVAPPIQEDPVVPVQDEPVADTPGRDPFTTQPSYWESIFNNYTVPDIFKNWVPPSLPGGIGPAVDPKKGPAVDPPLLPPPPGWSYEGPDRTSQVPSNFQQILPYISNTGIQNLTPPTTSNTVVPMGAQQLDTPINPVQGQNNPVAGQFMSSFSSQPQGQTNPVAGQFMPWQYTPLNQPLINPLQNNVAGNTNLQQPSIFAHSGGGIQQLINNQRQEYGVANQDKIAGKPSPFTREPFSATPHEDLTSGSHSYVSNVLNGHAVPMGMTNVQQLQKPMEAFPSGGQMNYNNTLHADYSRPQSFYAMPNMNKVG